MLSLAAISVALSPHPKIPFLADKARRLTSGFVAREPDLGGVGDGGVLGRALVLRIQPKRFELPTPFCRSIAQPRDVDAARQATLDGSTDQLGSKEGERDGHVDMTDAASLAHCCVTWLYSTWPLIVNFVAAMSWRSRSMTSRQATMQRIAQSFGK